VIRLSSADGVATEVAADAPEEDPVPTDEHREAMLEILRTELGDAVVGSHIRPGDDLWVRVTRESWVTTGEVVKARLGCTFFEFLSAIDWLPSPFGRDMDSQEDIVVHGQDAKEAPAMTTGYAGGDTRMQVFARVTSLEQRHGLTLKVDLPDDDLTIDTWSSLYRGADWHEREIYEMFGITFVGHPHLINMYLPGDFEGNPMRKDFPLLARRVKPWPGIVDVEPMPGGVGDEDEEGSSE
jgi:NADH-quinone oxidoreductase subunit C